MNVNHIPDEKIIKLPSSFYLKDDVLFIARDLIGKVLVTEWNGVRTSGRIVETEAYAGVTDKASHAYGGRYTNRTRIMYEEGGTAYVYLCYGVHHLFNVVTHTKGIPHAVLVRALEPLEGMETMMERTGSNTRRRLTTGPGKLARALGIDVGHSGLKLVGNELWIGDDGFRYPDDQIIATPRIGVDYAGEDARLPYRFIVRGHPDLSGKRNQN